MKRTPLFWMVAASALASSGYVAAQSGAAAIGVTASVVKDVKLSNAGLPKPRPVVLRQRVALADLIQTGKGSQLQVLLLDRSTFSIGANAILRIDRFVYDPARGRSSGASVTRGAFRFMSGQSNRANNTTVSSPVATIGIRGTVLEGVVGEGAIAIARGEIREVKQAKADNRTATLVVLRGPGQRTEAGTDVGAASVSSGGVTVELTEPMQAAFVPREGAAPIGPFRISPTGLVMLEDQIFPVRVSGAGFLGGLLKVLPAVLPAFGGSGNGKPQVFVPPKPVGQPSGIPGVF
jgi:hypothetical protein